ncbi:glycoside hydrolase family 3 protein [Pseudopedobacter beijingensis]|uniref:beta-N-acetylhexosaminidase n=1 Tax=Pseudopedobacter beijingensis TaxID=1207056 RepID=A0ABW4IC46_9SPHI
MKRYLLLAAVAFSVQAQGQMFLEKTPEARHWADSVQRKLSKRQKITQLMVIRVSEKQGGKDVFFEEKVTRDVKKYKIGALCLFQGEALKQAEILNKLQAMSRIPLMVTIDGETGVGMRFSDVKPFPNQLTIGATHNPQLAYLTGKAIAEQCKLAGIHVNYAPVVDINNNPANPVINVRSFGEDKNMVANMGVQITKGMQDNGVMACAKHFPGHGDVSVDSHYDLPVILKSKEDLEKLELYPFRKLTEAGVGSMMMAHLYIPAIDAEENKATSISKNNVTDLLRKEVHFNGLTFTDALEMKGVAKFYPQGLAAAKSIIAGNDMLCLPGDIKGAIKKIRQSIRKGEMSWKDIDEKVNRVLLAKYNLQVQKHHVVDTFQLVQKLNKDVYNVKREIYEQAITLADQKDEDIFNFSDSSKVAYVAIGAANENDFAKALNKEFKADVFLFSNISTENQQLELLNKIGVNYNKIIVGLHGYSKNPANNFGISTASWSLLQQLQQKNNVLNFVFGNPYAAGNIVNAKNLVVCYEDDPIMHETAMKVLKKEINTSGKLPVSISKAYSYGTGLSVK